MSLLELEDERVEIIPLALPLDRATISWLARLAGDDHCAAELVASMIRSIREDDEACHRSLH